MSYPTPVVDPTAVVGRRIGAYAIDFDVTAIVLAIVIIPAWSSQSVTAPSGTIECGSTSTGDGPLQDTTTGFETSVETSAQLCFDDGDEVHYIPEDEVGGFLLLFYAAAFGTQLANLVVLQGLTGASVGKAAVGLRVVRTDGRRAGIGWAALRWLLLQVDSICCFLPGLVLVFVTKGHRRLGDMAASTYVVRKEQVGTPVVLPGEYGPGAGPMPGWGTPTQQWGAPSSPSGAWGGPAAGPGTWSPPSDPSTPAAEGPTWDPGRNAYIQYDRDRSAWLQWSDAAGEWRPIDQ